MTEDRYSGFVVDDQRLALAPHSLRLLDQAQPASPPRLASAADWAQATVETALCGLPPVDWDEHGRKAGADAAPHPAPLRRHPAHRRGTPPAVDGVRLRALRPLRAVGHRVVDRPPDGQMMPIAKVFEVVQARVTQPGWTQARQSA